MQEQPLPEDLSAAIPAHIQTEDHIPPILEASSLAITDDQLDPDEVEIVTSSLHLPAATGIAQHENAVASGTRSPVSMTASAVDIASTHQDGNGVDEAAVGSHYGTLDSADVRRLSFISFADIVHGEHALENSVSCLPRDLSLVSSSAGARSPSPILSPLSSHTSAAGCAELGPSPPTSGASSINGLDMLGGKAAPPVGAHPASPSSFSTAPGGTHSPPVLAGAELTVQTMRQALGKTGSGELLPVRSPASPVEPRPCPVLPVTPELAK